jgi:hypothetical protein
MVDNYQHLIQWNESFNQFFLYFYFLDEIENFNSLVWIVDIFDF